MGPRRPTFVATWTVSLVLWCLFVFEQWKLVAGEIVGKQKKDGCIHLLVHFLSVRRLLVIVFLYWWPLLLSMVIAKGLTGLEMPLFLYPFKPGSGRALPLISRLGMPHHFLLVSSNITHNFLNSLSLFKLFFFLSTPYILCWGLDWNSSWQISKGIVCSIFRKLRLLFQFNSRLFLFFVSCNTIHQLF